MLTTLHAAVEASEATPFARSAQLDDAGSSSFERDGDVDSRFPFHVWRSQRSSTRSLPRHCSTPNSTAKATLLGGSPDRLRTFSALEPTEPTTAEESSADVGASSEAPPARSFQPAEGAPLLLHLGGRVSRSGWVTVNIDAQSGP